MDQFVTTYRKDFLWPYVRTFGIKPEYGIQEHDALCKCQCQSGVGGGDVQRLGPNVFAQESYQKSGPTTPLMDPMLYPSRVGPAPESEAQRINQPNIFLEKLRVKYPFLYEVLRTAAPDDIITRIHKDRLRTTYQVDFCHMNEYPSAPYDELIKAAKVSGISGCQDPVRLPGDPCRPKEKPSGYRPNMSKKNEGFGGGEKRCGNQGLSGGGGTGGQTVGIGGTMVSMGATEYQEAISKLGELIIRDKIHHHYRRK